jgi:hypothetical protein
MSWFRLLLPLILSSACGGSVDTPHDDGGAGGGKATGGAGNGGSSGGGGGVSREPEDHRPTEVTCGTRPPGAGGVSSPPTGDCAKDEDCTSGFNGRCTGRGMECEYDRCFADSDCESGSVCLCGAPAGTGNHCSEKGCRVDADCPGSWCSPTFGTCGNYSGVVGYACHTQSDECVDDADCGDSGGYCWYSPMIAHWLCSTAQCVG